MRKLLLALALLLSGAAPALAQSSQNLTSLYINNGDSGSVAFKIDSTAATTAGACLAASGTFPKQTLAGSHAVNAQTGTTYTVANTDQCKLVTLSNSSAVAVTLPQAGAASQFLAGWSGCLMDEGTGAATITPTTSTIDGASSLALNTGQGTCIYSDGTNYSTSGKTGGGASGTAGGDLTGTYPNPTIANNAVTNAKAAQMAAHTIKGNNTGSTANAADLTDTQVTAELNDMVGDSGSGGTKGLVPAPASGDAAGGKYLKADGTWAVPPGGSASPGGSSGDIQYNNSGAFGGRSLSATLDTIGSTQGDVLYRNATGWTVLAPGTSGQLLASGGSSANPSWITASGTGTVTSVTCGTGLTGGTITGSGTCALSTPVSVANGGTGASSLTAHGVVLGNGTSTVDVTSAGTSGQPLVSGGASADPAFGAITSAAVSFRGALLQKTSTQSISANTATAVSFDSSVYDTGGFYNHGSQPTRLTIPSGVSYVRLTGYASWNSAQPTLVYIAKNGTTLGSNSPGLCIHDIFGSGGASQNIGCTTGVIAVSAGDYFELYVYTANGTGGTIQATGNTYLSLEVVQ